MPQSHPSPYHPQASQLALRWPHEAGLAISFVLNIEEGAQLRYSAGDGINEGTHEVVNTIAGAPDYCMETHFEYGARAGYERIAKRFIEAQCPLTLNVCGRALQHTPWVAQEALAHNWELCGHGWRWESPVLQDPNQERQNIERTMACIAEHWGRLPSGWHCKSSASTHTRSILQSLGFAYDSDYYGSDMPWVVQPEGRAPYVVLPYGFDTNDMRFFSQGGFVHAEDFARYTIEAIEVLLQEARHAPRMLTIGLHTRILGRPARIRALDQILAHIRARSADPAGIWCATREQIAAHWLAQTLANPANL
ncbi:chitin deacetylase [Lampropedia puyangensis]|uniref:Chitin deacetylase n=1 Tax=Lampropedia puyangensis TaxID=1330072 RepID=A0A4S8FF11_9BURK|nr:polysaccharide deacetylase family protein [Lampropedia puyangensis]THU04482.1 chitin deacetylase [Lampropedia puyangensis]